MNGGGFKTERGQNNIKRIYEYFYSKCLVYLDRKKQKFIYGISYPAKKKVVVDAKYRRAVWARYYAKNKKKLLEKQRNKNF